MVKIEKVQIEGARELDQLLRQLPEKMAASALNSSVRAGAKVIFDEAKARVPVDTGSLRDSIRIQKVKESGKTVVFKVGPDKDRWYGIFTEFGTSLRAATPWLRPAFDVMAQKALDKIGESLGKKIEKIAEKLAGPLMKSGLIKRTRRRK